MNLRGSVHAAVVVISFTQAGTLRGENVYTHDPPSLDSVSDMSIDINRDGQVDFRPGTLADWTGSRDFAIAQPYRPGNGFLTNGFIGLPLMTGAVIGPNPSKGIWMDDRDSIHISFYDGVGRVWHGPWAEAGAAYLGVSVNADDGVHYGWIRLRVEEFQIDLTLPDGSPATWSVGPHAIDWAYESTPNMPIVAGAVPEPATWAMLLVGIAIVAGWRLWRVVVPSLVCILIPAAANAEIVYRTAARPGSEEPFDLDGNGQLDFAFRITSTTPDPEHFWIYFAIQQAHGQGASNGVLVDGDGVPPLPDGTVIGPNAQPLVWDDTFVDREIPDVSPVASLLGFPPSPATQFIGVRLQADDGLHYGWVRLARTYWAPYDLNHPNWPDDPGSVPNFALPRVDTFNPGVIDWAYESTPNTPIVAGAVPEPAGAVLGLIGLVGGLIALCFRSKFVSRLGTPLDKPAVAPARFFREQTPFQLGGVYAGPRPVGVAARWALEVIWFVR